MTESRQPQINEELLSAYVDDEVTNEERTLVEAAMAADPAVAWQVESLRQTVHLLQALPPLALPRTFTLETVIADVQSTNVVTRPHVATPRSNPTQPPTGTRRADHEQQSNWWQRFLQIWQGGNLQLRNAATVAFTLLVVFLVSDRLVTPTQLRQPTPSAASSTIARTTSASAAPANEAVALATATMETVIELASTAAAPTPIAAPQADDVTTTSVQSAKRPAGQNAPMPSQDAAKMPGQTGEDTEDITGAQPASPSAQSMRAGSPATVGTSDSQGMNTRDNSTAAGTQDTSTANAITRTVTAAQALIMTATLTVTPTATVTATAIISAASSTTRMNSLEASPGGNAQALPTPTKATQPWLAWAEIMTGVGAIILGSMWWRSRGGAHA